MENHFGKMSCNRERPITSCKITFGTRTNCSRHLAAAIGGEENNQKQSDDHGHSVKKTDLTIICMFSLNNRTG